MSMAGCIYNKTTKLFVSFIWNELTILWNDLTILWNDLTIDWNDLTWNDLTMERNDRIPLRSTRSR